MDTALNDNNQSVIYSDRKRYLWLTPLIISGITPLTIWLYFWSGSLGITLFIPMIYFFVFIPVLDMLIGEDPYNPTQAMLDDMEQDSYYRLLLFMSIPVYYASFFFAAWFVGTQEIAWWALIVFALGLGTLNSVSLVIGHELGHKHNKWDQIAAKIVIAMVGYGHFTLEHNRGHHVWVSTPEDPASSRLGESIYQFLLREIPSTFVRGLSFERARLNKKGYGFWNWRNDILQGYAITLGIAAVLIGLFGPIMIVFLIVHHMFGWYGLTQANYVEHYGLKRRKLDNGKYEACEPRHSWNTNHIVSNLISFHLQRHSDHHSNPQRPYQVLRNFPDLPTLPSGYPGCFGLAAIPPLWFRVMDPKVMAWADGDMTQINFCPKKFNEDHE